ncbi:OsmC family protein [Geofilum rubicundum]|uniref:OsmC family protein n=1 Tax=Geofilum rubicundum JCM 15548 TaxID=1236989 RepID=A0A0E9M1E9_9BACT|nr:OsmC family protein [Geofilum rubicundum]GAO31627.1 hypothetical protein JCM15548_14007 [Geofilum rubicundum JCM 15548]
MTKLTFAISGENRNDTRLDVDARQFRVVVDEPVALGGNDAGPNPVEYILAGYAGCLNVVGHLVAREMGIAIHKLSVEVAGDLNPARFLGQSFEERSGFQEIRVDLQVYSDSDEATLARWLEVVETRCPVYDNLANTTPVKLGVNKLESVYY